MTMYDDVSYRYTYNFLTAKVARGEKETRRLGKGEFLRVFFASFAVFAVNKLVSELL